MSSTSENPANALLGAVNEPPRPRRAPPLPPYVINGIAVAAGIGMVHVSALAVGSTGAAQVASTGAMYASLPHLVDRAGRATRRALAGGVVGSMTALVVGTLEPVPWALHLGLAALVFAAMMTMAWGPRAGPISFTVILAIVFSLGAAHRTPLPHAVAWTLGGAVLYSVLAHVSTLLLEPRYRTLAIANAIGASARLMRSRAAVLETHASAEREPGERWAQIDEETRLATLLQSARDLVFSDEEHGDRFDRAELLLRATELRDLLLTSRLDLDLLGEDDLAYVIRTRLAESLRAHAAALTDIEFALTSGTVPSFDRVAASKVIASILDERGLPADDPRLRLLPPIASRQQRLIELIAEFHRLLRWGRPEYAASTVLEQHLGDERWPLSELTRHLSLESPVFRHAARSALAITFAHAVSTLLPWATHPHWMVLSVAVVLRGTFAQTLSRRNDRVVGTALGCFLALGLATFLPPAALIPLPWLAAGTAHAYVNVRYTLTAVAATVMALLQTRTFEPITTGVMLERLADTVLGAGFAWAFSYVLPSWSRRSLPALLETTLGALAAYAESAPSLAADGPARQRVARERAYNALEAFIAAVRLSRVEPERVRPPLPLLLSFIDHAQSLMSHLSSLRLMLLRRAEQLRGPETDQTLASGRLRLAKRLTLDSDPYSASPRIQPLNLELPSVPAERAAFPWLVRRLNIAIYEADLAGQAARSALGVLRERASLRP